MTEAIKKVLESKKSIEIAKNHLPQLERRLSTAYQRLHELAQQVEEEYRDIEKIEQLNVISLFKKVLGNKEEQLEKERQDYLRAILLHKEQLKEVELLEFEQKILIEKISQEEKIEQELSNLILQQQQIAKYSNSTLGRQIKHMELEAHQTFLTKREILEAIIAGTKALKTVEQISEYLQKAVEFCEWQTTQPGLAKALKQTGYTDKARALAPFASQQLHLFVDELNDIHQKADTKPDIDSERFLHFTEYLFDDFISDWVVAGKVQNSYYNTLASKDKLTRTLGNLKAKLKKAEIEIEYLENRRNELILKNI